MAAAPPLKGDYIAKSAKRHGVPERILRSMARAESSNRTSAVSPRGARGELQVMPATAKELGYTPEEMHDPEYGAEAGARYARKMYDRFGNWEDAVAAYNAGPARIAHRKKKGLPFPRETRGHVRKVLGNEAADALGGTLE